MLVNLDPWLDLSRWRIDQDKGVAVIDKCLKSTPSFSAMGSPRTSLKKKSPRRQRKPPKRNEDFIADKPSGDCPKCRNFVPNEGVVCVECNAFLHYECAGVTQYIVDNEWANKDFLCEIHRPLQGQGNDNKGELCLPVKINSYTLNPQTRVKKITFKFKCQA